MSIYLLIKGIEGHVTAQGLQNHIELESFSFNVKRRLYTQPGSVYDRESSKPAVGEVVVTKRVDKTTPLFFGDATGGSAKGEAIIKFVSTHAMLSEYLTITLYNVLVSGYELTDQIAEPDERGEPTLKLKPLERIAFNFDKIEVKYTPYDASNKAGSPIPAGYDLRRAQAT